MIRAGAIILLLLGKSAFAQPAADAEAAGEFSGAPSTSTELDPNRPEPEPASVGPTSPPGSHPAQAGLGHQLDAPRPNSAATVTLNPQPLQLRQIAARRSRRARLFPKPAEGHVVGLDLHPYVSDVIGGILVVAEHRYSTDAGFWTSLRLGPMGVARADGDRLGAFDSAALAGWEGRFFAAGVGAGYAFARIDEARRRSRGWTPTGLLQLRAGAYDGLHMMLELGATVVQGEIVGTSIRHHVRYPFASGRYLDIRVGVALPLAWIYLNGGIEMDWPFAEGPTRVRIRPHVGIGESIDPVTRDGGGGFSLGLELIYRTSPVKDGQTRAEHSLPQGT